MSVSMTPGLMAFTRMLLLAYSMASTRVIDMTAPSDAAYERLPPTLAKALTDELFTIVPPPAPQQCRMACLQPKERTLEIDADDLVEQGFGHVLRRRHGLLDTGIV